MIKDKCIKCKHHEKSHREADPTLCFEIVEERGWQKAPICCDCDGFINENDQDTLNEI